MTWSLLSDEDMHDGVDDAEEYICTSQLDLPYLINCFSEADAIASVASVRTDFILHTYLLTYEYRTKYTYIHKYIRTYINIFIYKYIGYI